MTMKKFKRLMLATESYRVIPDIFIQELGYTAALLLSHFCNLSDMLGEEFFQQKERIIKEFQFTRGEFDSALSLLEQKNLIYISRRRGCKHTYSIVETELNILIRMPVLSYAERKAKEASRDSQQASGGPQQASDDSLVSSKQPTTKPQASHKEHRSEFRDVSAHERSKDRNHRGPQNFSVTDWAMQDLLDDFEY